jgi:hypothetical protein
VEYDEEQVVIFPITDVKFPEIRGDELNEQELLIFPFK